MKKIFFILCIIGLGAYLAFLLVHRPEKQQETPAPPPVQTTGPANKQTPLPKKDANKTGQKNHFPKTKAKPQPKQPANNKQPGTGSPQPQQEDQHAGKKAELQVPPSYPVQEAGKYFVPPEERRPGHLGGPPPPPAPALPAVPATGN